MGWGQPKDRARRCPMSRRMMIVSVVGIVAAAVVFGLGLYEAGQVGRYRAQCVTVCVAAGEALVDCVVACDSGDHGPQHNPRNRKRKRGEHL